jgi:hypothetical protein
MGVSDASVAAGSRLGVIGVRVDRAASALPQTGSTAIFTVNTGGVLITSLIGKVATAFGATVTNLKLQYTPSGGAATDLYTNVVVTSAAAGRTLTPNAAIGSALVLGAAGHLAGAPLPGGSGLYLPAGSLTMVTDASNTGTIGWQLTYIPYDVGATVTAA